MKKKFALVSIVVLAVFFFCNFAFQTPYFKIEAKDVALKIPVHFPKPVYNFQKNRLSADIFVLGRKLFYDNLLSKDNTVNCGTCHQRIAAFAHIDHALSHGIYAKIGTRNVPALQNLIWKDAFMWDGSVKELELQPVNPITNPIEMDETMASVVSKLEKEVTYRKLFFKAFKDSTVTQNKILKALAQFTGLMISAKSRYDNYVLNKDTLSFKEKRGLTLFRQKCAGCHKEPLFTNNAYKNNGILPDTSLNDVGREKVSGLSADKYKFKVPSLRNIEMTYPYMHDGRFRNLQAVLSHYSKPENFATGSDPLLKNIGALSLSEQSEIIAFLKTLTDKSFLYDRRFVDPAFENGY